MKSNEIIFDENYEMNVKPEGLDEEICLVISDDLDASDEELTEDYRCKIANFVNELPQWYSKACSAILVWAKSTYKVDAQVKDLQLMNIFVLFEQNEDELFGLEFEVEFDDEHGCGLKIKGEKGNYEITEIGTGDVAFC